MNDLTEALLKSYKPRLAIIAYTPTLEDWNKCYLESHAIDAKGRLLEGKPLKQDTIQEMVDVFFDDRQNSQQLTGLIPSNLLKFEILPGGHYEMIWYRPQEVRQMFFEDGLKIPNGKAWQPALIYSVSRRDLSVFAITSDERPGENTLLYRAPYHNTNKEGEVCLGSAGQGVKKPASRNYKDQMKYWEDIFWLSEFSHLAGSKNPTKSNLNLLWKKMLADEKLTWQDSDQLLPCKEDRSQLKLEDLL